MRIGGLASGMDIDSLVADLMKAERMPLDKIKQKKQVLEWQRDDYRAMNTLLLNFRTELTQMKLTTKYRVRSVSSTNEERVSATASSAASMSSYSISNVKQLASAATRLNEGEISGGTKIDSAKSLYSQKDNLANDSTAGVFRWSNGVVGTKSITVDSDNQNIFSLELGTNEKILASEMNNMTVKVDGKAYNIVANEADLLNSDQVFLSATGTLKFKDPLTKNSVVKVDYVTDQKVESKTLTDPITEWQVSNGALVSDLKLNVTTNGVTKTYGVSGAPTPTPDTDGFINLVNIADSNDVIGKINLETGKITFTNEQAKDTKLEITYKQEYAAFNITSHTSKGPVTEKFLVEGTDSLNTVINKVNSSNAGVTMFYDSSSDRISLTRTETGNFRGNDPTPAANESYTYNLINDGEIETSGDFINKLLKFSGATETGGENAIFEINGLATERNSNTFEINGVTFTLKQTFSDSPVSLSVKNDSDKVFENIKSFVDKYNELIGKIQDKLSEERYRSYQPLTDEQREQLSDKQQEQWEEKAKSGLLRRDPILAGVLSQMRTDFYSQVTNDNVSPLYNQLAAIGITTTGNYLEGGKLEINEAKLKKAIETDPSSVENLFRTDGLATSQKGITQRLYDTVNATMDKLKERAGNSFSTNKQFTLGKELDSIDDRIDRFEDRLTQIEDRYWRQFTAMEKAIQQSNSQSMYLMQQFGGGM
ncbi:flagellar filament capping protein FliD [Bacillus songklensis]|uniref:Flagellar hook-associated protein 2 n=1 Tax=Bacillus songklensis TaxID=1069116 RepID=A0ABV8B867_9BACI